MTMNDKIKRKFKWFLLPVIAVFVAVLVLSLSAGSAAFSSEAPSVAYSTKVTNTESVESSTPVNSYSTGLTVRCNVIIDK